MVIKFLSIYQLILKIQTIAEMYDMHTKWQIIMLILNVSVKFYN